MCVGKGKSIGHTKNAIDYALNKPGAEEIARNLIIGENGQEISAEFSNFQCLNSNCEKNTYSFVLSPAIADGKKLTNDDWKSMSKDFLEKLNLYKDHQSITVKHTDRGHAHLHIIVNRVSLNGGNAHNDSYISIKSQSIADELAKERGLIRAKDIQLEKELMQKSIKAEISAKINEVLKQRPISYDDFKIRCADKGLNITETVNKAGALQGYRIDYQGENFKASEIDKKITLHHLQDTMSINQNISLQKIKPNPLSFKQHLKLDKSPKERPKQQKQARYRQSKEEYLKQKLFNGSSHFTVVINDIHQQTENKSPVEQKTNREIENDHQHHISR